MYELAMANGLVDITHRPKLPSIIATTMDGTKVPFQLLQVSKYSGDILLIYIYAMYILTIKRLEHLAFLIIQY